MATDTVAFLEALVGGPAHLLGCSPGAVTALLVALRQPELVGRLALVSGVFHRDGWLPEAVDPDLEPHPAIVAAYAQPSPDGPGRLPILLEKLRRMDHEEPTLTPSALGAIASRTLVMLGDDDEVRLEHATAMYRAIHDAELAVAPGTSHGLLHEKPALRNAILTEFLSEAAVATIAPVSRAGR
jgi:pimeloyl-ACP methyl ester carboxylesterase